MTFKTKKDFYILSFTWGIIMTFIGLAVAAVLLCLGYNPEKWGPCFCFRVGRNWGGASFGPIMLISATANEAVKNHEFGHAIQNCFYGFTMPFIVCIPSVIRYWYRKIRTYCGLKNESDYDAIWFEGEATRLGTEQINQWQ